MPFFVPVASYRLAELSPAVAICTPIGFPLGAHATVVKVVEGVHALKDGANEIDMVMNISALKSGHPAVVRADLVAVVHAAHERGAIVKVIIETSILTDDEKKIACEHVAASGADFIKTSTGFVGGGATVDDVALLRRELPDEVRIKASGGIRDLATAIAMINAGADRIGTSSGVAIVAEDVAQRSAVSRPDLIG
jgi:deoxyribose-phosphate aldolase